MLNELQRLREQVVGLKLRLSLLCLNAAGLEEQMNELLETLKRLEAEVSVVLSSSKGI